MTNPLILIALLAMDAYNRGPTPELMRDAQHSVGEVNFLDTLRMVQ